LQSIADADGAPVHAERECERRPAGDMPAATDVAERSE
jgi:hypothetical protein